MNQYLLALLGFIIMLVVGFFFYGLFFKDLTKEAVKPTTGRLAVSLIAMYLVALAYTIVYRNITFASNVDGAIRGLYLGLLLSVPFLGLPLLIDGFYLKTKDNLIWLIVLNWIVSFALLGVLVGSLA